MLSQQRYEGEASMAATARDTAQSDEAYVTCDQAWAAFFVAARHALLFARWSKTAADDSQAAAQSIRPGTTNDAVGLKARFEARAERSAQIAAKHREAAEMKGEEGFALALAAKAAAGNGNPSTLEARSWATPQEEARSE
jgi:hypothetical protein